MVDFTTTCEWTPSSNNWSSPITLISKHCISYEKRKVFTFLVVHDGCGDDKWSFIDLLHSLNFCWKVCFWDHCHCSSIHCCILTQQLYSTKVVNGWMIMRVDIISHFLLISYSKDQRRWGPSKFNWWASMWSKMKQRFCTGSDGHKREGYERFIAKLFVAFASDIFCQHLIFLFWS